MAQAVLALAVSFFQGVLKRAANATWDDLWIKIFEGVGEAEKRWEDHAEKGSVKRQEVIDTVLAWLGKKTDLNFFERWVARLLIGNVIDSVIDELNKKLGKDWIKTAKEVESQLADWLPIID